jgi:ankyrin repeat protein
MTQSHNTNLFELIKKQRAEGLILGIKDFIEASKLDLNVGVIHAKNMSLIEGESPLVLATKHWNLDLIKLMLDNGANPNYQNKEQAVNGSFLAASAIFYQTYCPESQRKKIISLMCDYGLDVNILNHANETLLFHAVQRACLDKDNDYSTIDYLIGKGIYLNHNYHGKSVLNYAIRQDNETLACHLIDLGAKDDSLLKMNNHALVAKKVANYYKSKKEKEQLEKMVIEPPSLVSKKVKL